MKSLIALLTLALFGLGWAWQNEHNTTMHLSQENASMRSELSMLKSEIEALQNKEPEVVEKIVQVEAPKPDWRDKRTSRWESPAEQPPSRTYPTYPVYPYRTRQYNPEYKNVVRSQP